MNRWAFKLLVLSCFLIWPVSSSAGPLSERIFVVSSPFGIPKIYIARPDGRDLSRFTKLYGPEREPAVSYTAKAIVFRRTQNNNDDLYLLDLNGRNLRRLTTSRARDIQPSWSPDGRRIVFVTYRWGEPELAIINVKDRAVTRLTWDQRSNLFPSWSPKGDQIAYVSYQYGIPQLFVISPDGSKRRRLLNVSSPQTTPHWSPDGNTLIFQTTIGPKFNSAVALVDPDSPDSYTILPGPFLDPRFPVWSPDGRHLLLSSGKPGHRSLMVYDYKHKKAHPLEWGNFPPLEFDWQYYPLPWGK